MDVTFIVRGEPRGKATPNPVVCGRRRKVAGHTVVIDPHARARKDPETALWEQRIAAAAAQHLPPERPKAPVQVDILAVMPRPQRLFRRTDPEGVMYAVRKPDIDNIRKSAQDALKAHWSDDTVVVVGKEARVYAEKHGAPRLVIRVHDKLPDLTRPPPWLAHLIDFDALAGDGDWIELEAP